jgi:hypothetical protein
VLWDRELSEPTSVFRRTRKNFKKSKRKIHYALPSFLLITDLASFSKTPKI